MPKGVGRTELTGEELLNYINSTPDLLSLLYDIDLLPEQTLKVTHNWERAKAIANMHKTFPDALDRLKTGIVAGVNKECLLAIIREVRPDDDR